MKFNKGFLSGLIYGIVPHIFCIAFVVFSVIGATAGTVIFRKFLLVPYFFQILVLISFVFATISALIYLKRNGILSFPGVKRKWKYLSILYGTTLLVNVFFFLIVFPAVANVKAGESTLIQQTDPSLITTIKLSVDIPCSGHAPLIIDDLKKIDGVGTVKFKLPNTFEVSFNLLKTSKEKILDAQIFKTFKATIKQ